METLPKHRRSPWHAGERALQQKIGASDRMEAAGQKFIRDYLPDQHRDFYHQLPFMIVGAVDAENRPWATLIEGPEGFVSSPDPKHLSLDSAPDPQDPAAPGLQAGSAIGMLGIELHTRRRNRINGVITQASERRLEIAVEHAFGNCPQYIQRRTYTRFSSELAVRPPRQDLAELDPRAVEMIDNADTFFVASYMVHDDQQRSVDVSHRGGRPGFIKVQGNRLVIPDYAGNLHFNTLGNLQLNPKAGLLFVDFSTGDVLQLSGRTELILESPMINAFEGAERLWTFDVEQVVHRPGAVSLRWQFEEFAPTSLMTGTWAGADQRLREIEQRRQWHQWRVVRVEQEATDIRSLYIEALDGAAVTFLPGQHIPVRLQPNGSDVLIRTYSVSSAPSDNHLRISVKVQGPASRYLHEQLHVGDVLEIRHPLGSFTLKTDSERPVVLIGAGVGITPLLSMARELVAQIDKQQRSQPVYLFQGGKTLHDLPFQNEIQQLKQRASGLLHLWRALSNAGENAQPGVDFELSGRLTLKDIKANLPLDDYDFYLCGPASFTQDMYDGLRSLNIPDLRIHAEAFGPSTLQRHGDAQRPILIQPPPASTPVPVYFATSAKEARWTPQAGSLLELAESRGLNPDFSCRGGSCGTCRTRLISGQVHYPNPPAELPEDDMVLICCAVPAEGESGIQPLVLDL
ncbi:pyridoxamine 5'-phosphate oxidase family protein [Pseudomonas sp. G.S.17]|uniref:pyridoxamine 5'-phosphate oxidase family protein n=1 Tax=Pseudomonas sp. G.S.17 TaxID=3137451 RepID=UPI00311CAA69